MPAKKQSKKRSDNKTDTRDAQASNHAIPEAGNVRPLTPQQELFCAEYLVDYNGTKAAQAGQVTPKRPQRRRRRGC